MKILMVFFDDCHRPSPELGIQPLPVAGVHNAGWQQSPGQKIALQFHDGTVSEEERTRLRDYVQQVLKRFTGDERILMWDVYNEAGNDDKSNELLTEVWSWAKEVKPSQPLTACLDGTFGEKNVALNARESDIITFHRYEGDRLEEQILKHKENHSGRPIICTEYMAREMGTTFQHSLPIFKKHGVGCYNWGFVAGKSQTHFNWGTVDKLEELKEQGALLQPGDAIPEPPLWFHDIYRIDGTPFDEAEIACIKQILS